MLELLNRQHFHRNIGPDHACDVCYRTGRRCWLVNGRTMTPQYCDCLCGDARKKIDAEGELSAGVLILWDVPRKRCECKACEDARQSEDYREEWRYE